MVSSRLCCSISLHWLCQAACYLPFLKRSGLLCLAQGSVLAVPWPWPWGPALQAGHGSCVGQSDCVLKPSLLTRFSSTVLHVLQSYPLFPALCLLLWSSLWFSIFLQCLHLTSCLAGPWKAALWRLSVAVGFCDGFLIDGLRVQQIDPTFQGHSSTRAVQRWISHTYTAASLSEASFPRQCPTVAL